MAALADRGWYTAYLLLRWTTGLLGLAPAADGARLFYRRLISGTTYELNDQALPASGLAGTPAAIGPAATNLTLASAPIRAADGSLILALRQRGADSKDELWVTSR